MVYIHLKSTPYANNHLYLYNPGRIQSYNNKMIINNNNYNNKVTIIISNLIEKG